MEETPRILVTYTSNAGSTKEVAERIAAKISVESGTVDVLPADQVEDVSPYSGVVLGGPMILGWHRRARRFYRKHRNDFKGIPHHIFMTAMKVTGSAGPGVITVDPEILTSAADPGKLSLKEKFTTVEHYTAPVNKKIGGSGPASIAIFGGKLDYTKLKLPQMLFVMLVVGEAPGEKRNWSLMEEWANGLSFE
jgi:menaquinone-dependent protoporphyrinogen IX oxidase